MKAAQYKREREAALKLVNEARKLLGKRPVKALRRGIPGRTCFCPIAATIDPNQGVAVVDGVSGYITIYCRGNSGNYTTVLLQAKRKTANRFIELFDKKRIPDLIKAR